MNDKREYVIVCNEHKGLFRGCLLFWGHRTEDKEKRCFGGYTSNLDECERYTLEEIKEVPNIPVVEVGEEHDFRKLQDAAVKINDLLKAEWLRSATVIYRP